MRSIVLRYGAPQSRDTLAATAPCRWVPTQRRVISCRAASGTRTRCVALQPITPGRGSTNDNHRRKAESPRTLPCPGRGTAFSRRCEASSGTLLRRAGTRRAPHPIHGSRLSGHRQGALHRVRDTSPSGFSILKQRRRHLRTIDIDEGRFQCGRWQRQLPEHAR
jgi:hypothetical protein